MANERHACAKETVRERTRATKAARASDMDSAFQGMTVLLRSPCQCTKKCYPCPFHTVTHVASRDSCAPPGATIPRPLRGLSVPPGSAALHPGLQSHARSAGLACSPGSAALHPGLHSDARSAG